MHPELSRRQWMAGVGAAATAQTLTLPGRAADATADPLTRLIELEVRLAEWVRRHRNPILQAPPDGTGDAVPWADYGFKWPAYTLAHLWATPHPANPLHKQDWCAELAIDIYHKEVSGWLARRGRNGGISTGETPHYVAAYVLETLGDRIPADRRAQWLEHERAWVKQALVRPLGQTGRYHDSWRFTALYRLGEVLNEPAWTARGVELFHEMLTHQLPAGFWSEQRGPSFRYHGLMLPSLAWTYRWTGDERFGDAARKLVGFLTRYVYPDAVSVGPFDVRNSNVLAYFPICAGLELTPEGRTFSSRAVALWERLQMFDDVNLTMTCTRDVPRLAFYLADTVRYLSRYAPAATQAVDPNGKLPIDDDGVLGSHTAAFDGVLVRRGPWTLALSGQNPDGPRNSKSPYMLEGQSRIELWHEKARLTIGGGHNHRTWPIPFANVFLLTAASETSEFGKPAAGLPREIRTASYMPQTVAAAVVDGRPELRLDFAEGTVRFGFDLNNERQVQIVADWNLSDVRGLCLQMPLVVWRGVKLQIDEADVDTTGASPHIARDSIEVGGGPFGDSWQLRLPEGAPCRVYYPLYTGQFHDQQWDDDPIKGPFQLALASSQWLDPPATGKATFKLVV